MRYSNLYQNWQSKFIVEARIDKIKKQFPGQEELIDKLSKNDPSGNDTYLAWMIKQVNKAGDEQEVIDVTKNFHKNRQRLQTKDINQWKLGDLKLALSVLGKTRSEKAEEIDEQVIRIYEDDNYILLSPLSMDASCKYGAGTKWCISATKDKNYFHEYARDKEVDFIFFLAKNKDQEDPSYKIALVFYPEKMMKQMAEKLANYKSKPSFYDEEDDEDEDKIANFYASMSEQEIFEYISSSPQEIYDARDDLKCKMQIPVRMGYAHGIPNEFRDRHEADCDQYLDELLNGQWTKKYKKIVQKTIPKIRSGINDIIQKEKQEKINIAKEIVSWNGDINKIPLKNFKFIKGSVDNYPSFYSAYFKAIGIDENEEIPIVTFKAKLNFDLKDIGVQIPEYTLEEIAFLTAYSTNQLSRSPSVKNKEIVANIFYKLNQNDGPSQSLREYVEIIMEDRWFSKFSYKMRSIALETLESLGLGESALWGFDVNRKEITVSFLLDSDYMDYYIYTYESLKKLDNNLKQFYKILATKMLEVSENEIISGIAPTDRKYWFWEPIK